LASGAYRGHGKALPGLFNGFPQHQSAAGPAARRCAPGRRGDPHARRTRRVRDALRAHWSDRKQDLDAAAATERPGLPLVAPLVVPPTPRAREKFGEPADPGGETAGTATGGYSVRGARGLTQWAIAQLLEVMPDLTEPERRKLAGTSPHAFRHTVGTQMLAAGVALEVVQRTLGHASLGTTSIYISPEEARLRREAAKYHARLNRQT
jgi:integrase